MSSLTLLFAYQWINFKSVVQYRANFLSGLIGLALSSFFQLAAAIIVVERFGTAAGWDPWQIAFMFGLWRIQYGIMLMLYGPTWGIDFLIREGTIDRFLVRPRRLLFQLTGVRFSVSGVGQIIAGAVMAAIGAMRSPFEWTWWSIPWIVVFTVAGTGIQIGIWLLIGSLNFRHVRVDSAIRTIDRTSWQVTLFPTSVYSLAVQVLLTFVIPWAFMVFYPSHLLYDRGLDITFGPALMYQAPLVAVLTLTAGWLVWRWGVRSYQGLGGA